MKFATLTKLKFFVLFSSIILTSCIDLPENVTPVKDFNINEYLGTWYEIARLDNSFEIGLSKVTAKYELNKTGGITVINSGFSKDDNKWHVSKGDAKFVSENNIGHLKVSFFGPFYSSYIIFYLDEQYQYAFVAGYNKKYLWLLSRTPYLDQTIIDKFISTSEALGFDTSNLLYVQQD